MSRLPPSSRAALEAMAGQRYGLYRTPKHGYSTNPPHGPFHKDGTVNHLVRSGLAEEDPTGGNFGSVKITDEGRAALHAQGASGRP